MKFLLIASFLLIRTAAIAQTQADQRQFQDDLLQTYRNLNSSVDERKRLDKIEALPFFRFDTIYRVHAVLDTSGATGFEKMKTSLGRYVLYRKYGYLKFLIKGQSFRMPVYQAKSAVTIGSNELFFPFTDATNGETTYSAGRYIDLKIPAGTDLILDFNRAFNPYCAYSHNYSCELPPAENHFSIAIPAGLQYLSTGK